MNSEELLGIVVFIAFIVLVFNFRHHRYLHPITRVISKIITTLAAMLIGAVAGVGTWILSHSVKEMSAIIRQIENDKKAADGFVLFLYVSAALGSFGGLILVWLYRRLVRHNNRITIHLAEKVNELSELKRNGLISEAEYNHRKELLANY